MNTYQTVFDQLAEAFPLTEAQMEARMCDLQRFFKQGLSDRNIANRYAPIELIQLLRHYHDQASLER